MGNGIEVARHVPTEDVSKITDIRTAAYLREITEIQHSVATFASQLSSMKSVDARLLVDAHIVRLVSATFREGKHATNVEKWKLNLFVFF